MTGRATSSAPTESTAEPANSCTFCGILAGRLPARVVHEDDDACAFLDVNPLRLGHALVVPRRHVANLTKDGAAEAVAAIGPALQHTARLLSGKLDADGISVLQANGAAAGQTVFHLHFHLLPRPAGDAPLTDWTPDLKARDSLDETYRRLRSGEEGGDGG